MILYSTENITLLILRGCLASLKALALRKVLRGFACAGICGLACAGSPARISSHYNIILPVNKNTFLLFLVAMAGLLLEKLHMVQSCFGLAGFGPVSAWQVSVQGTKRMCIVPWFWHVFFDPKRFPKGSKVVQNHAKMAPRRPKIIPRRLQEDPKNA